MAAQGQTGYSGTDAIFYGNRNTQTVAILSGVSSGDYVLSTEVVSIRNNGDVSNCQFWPQAFSIRVTDGGDSAPVPTGKKGTELYSASDDLLQWNFCRHSAGETIGDARGPELAAVASGQKRAHVRNFSA